LCFFLDCDNHNPHDKSFILSFSAMIAPAIDLDSMVGDGAEQVDASANTFGILRSLCSVILYSFFSLVNCDDKLDA